MLRLASSVLAFALAFLPPAAQAQGAETRAQLRALSVRLDGQLVAERIDAYQSGYQVLLPLGELSALLGLGIRVQPEQGLAQDVVVRGGHRFTLDLVQGRANVGGRELSFEPRLALVLDGDIYVSTQLLARWLPIDLAVDLPAWQLRVRPRVPVAVAAPQATPVPERARPTPAAAAPRRDIDSQLLVLEVLLDGQVLSDSFSAYQDGSQTLLPLGELARLLTLPINVQADRGSASGNLLRDERRFALNLPESLVSFAGREQGFEPRLATVIGEDIYVAAPLLARWLPLDLQLDLATLRLTVKPRETLPLQARLAREREAARLGGAPAAERIAYPRQDSPIAWAGAPFIDQSFGADARFGRNAPQYRTAYTAYLTSDLFGMEGSAYVLKTNAKTRPDLRLTLARNDPDAGLLGPLRARSVQLGSVVMPSVRHVMQASPDGKGVAVSNRPLDQPSSFDRHSLRGDLPPGWDVTLYYNDALLAYQSARPDGQYAFEDLPLSFGANEFRLVFHGPLGQLRVERQSFLLDQAIVKPGQLFYALTQQYADHGRGTRSLAQLDFGLTPQISGSASLLSRPHAVLGERQQRHYAQLGLLAYLNSMILSAQATAMQGGGALGELGLKTRLGPFAVDLLHIERQRDFENDPFSDVAGGVLRRSEARLTGALRLAGLAPLSLALNAARSSLAEGHVHYQLGLRAATVLRGTALANTLAWRHGDASALDGNLQLSRRVANIGLNAQLAYTLQPVARLQALALTADHNLSGGYQINAGLLRSLDAGLTLVSGGVSRNFGSFGLALSASYSSQRETAVGLQLFAAIDRDPRTGRWNVEGQPLAGMGAVSARAFVDRNMNGRHDPGEEFVPNAAFLLNNGGRHPALTDAEGTARLTRLQPGRYADIALDPASLEDPQWKPLTPGVRVLPRPGRTDLVEFPVVATSEVEGTIFLIDARTGRRRGIGDARVELVNEQGQVIASATSSADGYYLLHQASPGRHTLRIAPEQAEKLRLTGTLARAVTLPPEGEFISGQDLELRLAER